FLNFEFDRGEVAIKYSANRVFGVFPGKNTEHSVCGVFNKQSGDYQISQENRFSHPQYSEETQCRRQKERSFIRPLRTNGHANGKLKWKSILCLQNHTLSGIFGV